MYDQIVSKDLFDLYHFSSMPIGRDQGALQESHNRQIGRIASGMHDRKSMAFSYQNVSSKTTHVTRRATLGFQTQPVAISMSPHAFVVGSASATRPRRPSPMPVPTSCGSVFLSSPLGLKNQRSHKKGAMKRERGTRTSPLLRC